jgi:hypothetical protein
MKYKLLFAFAVMCTAAVVIDSNRNAYSNAAGAPSGCSGSPGDGTTCANSSCHTGSAVTPVNGWITSTIPAGGYTPGKTYSLTAKAVYKGRSTFGFELSPQDGLGNILGTLLPAATTQVGSAGYITHRRTSITGTDSLSWTFNWTAPAYGSGPLTFYGAFNCANSDGATSGDLIYTSSLAVTEAPSPGVDAGIQAVVSPALFGCTTSITPVVKIANYGTTTLTSATINYHLDANTPLTLAWTGSLATNATQNVSLPAMAVTNGHHTFSASTSNPNSGADTIVVNDGHSISFDARLVPFALPFSEGFDSTVFPLPGWLINNPNNDTTWRRVTTASHSGKGSMFIDNYFYKQLGDIDELITPSFDLSALSTPILSFQLAYNRYDNAGSDTLVVAVSTDCGVSWTQLYKKFGVPLTTATPNFTTKVFVPTAAQWRFESIDLGAYKTATNAIFKFVNITDYENNMYLDEIRVNNSLGIVNLNAGKLSLNLFPNPATDQLFLNYELVEPSDLTVKIYNLQGKEMPAGITLKERAAGKYSQSLNLLEIPSGMYILQIRAGAVTETRRFVVSH